MSARLFWHRRPKLMDAEVEQVPVHGSPVHEQGAVGLQGNDGDHVRRLGLAALDLLEHKTQRDCDPHCAGTRAEHGAEKNRAGRNRRRAKRGGERALVALTY